LVDQLDARNPVDDRVGFRRRGLEVDLPAFQQKTVGQDFPQEPERLALVHVLGGSDEAAGVVEAPLFDASNPS
jgi:hypothetical protein